MIKTISGYISRKCKQKQQRIKRKWAFARVFKVMNKTDPYDMFIPFDYENTRKQWDEILNGWRDK